MEFLVSIAAAVIIGQAASRKGLNGLRWGAGVAALLLGTSGVIGLYAQAAGAAPYVWWVVAVVIVATAWNRLSSKPAQAPVSNEPSAAATNHAALVTEGPSVALEQKPMWRRGAEKVAPVVGLLIAVGIYHAVSDPSSTSSSASGSGSKFILPPASIDAAQLASATATRLPEDMPVVSWQSQGFGYSDRTRVYFSADSFGKIAKVDVDQLGVLSTSGKLHPIPKFALKYHADSAKGDILILASLNGAGKPIRLSFDGAQDYIELMPNSDGYVAGKMDSKLTKRMQTANTLTVLHGISATGGDLSFEYDLAELRQAIGIALAGLGTTPAAQ